MLQAASCRALGSELYGGLLEGLSDEIRTSDDVAVLLRGHSDRPIHDALPLRLLGAVHHLVLADRAPLLARHYPSAGGSPDGRLFADFLSTVANHSDFIASRLRQPVQTNEVGRSVVPLGVMNWLGGLGFEEVDYLEIGASAGLNLCFGSFRADTGHGVMGSDDADVRFDPSWFRLPPPLSPRPARTIRLAGSDLNPIDLSIPESVRRLESFVWPDQLTRLERLRAAIRVARSHKIVVARAGADESLADFLERGLLRPTVVFHSIVWQYLDNQTRDNFVGLLARQGAGASSERPLFWIRMEPAGETADVRVDCWMGGDVPNRTVLARVGYHGQQLEWLGP